MANKEINEGVKATNNRMCVCVYILYYIYMYLYVYMLCIAMRKKIALPAVVFFLLLVQKVKMLMMESQKIEGSQQHITYAWRVFYQDERAQFLQVCYHTPSNHFCKVVLVVYILGSIYNSAGT